MKIIEPISSSILITACAYAAGISYNNSYMRQFGVDPEFSQPGIEKALYDGGVTTFEVLHNHLTIVISTLSTSHGIIALLAIINIVLLVLLIYRNRLGTLARHLKSTSTILGAYTPIGLIGLTYIMFLTFSSFNRAEVRGAEVAEKFIKTCHWISLQGKDGSEEACAFKKDSDSIWYFKEETAGMKANMKPLSELSSIAYMTPETLIE